MANPQKLSDQLYLFNLDEIDRSNASVIDPQRTLANGQVSESFAENIISDLGGVIERVRQRWTPLDPAHPEKYLENLRAAPADLKRVCFAGLGAGADGAHIAYFGERQNIFEATSRIELGEAEAQRRNARYAVSIGSDVLQEFEQIFITVKESRKADSLLAGFLDAQQAIQNETAPKTGLGWLIVNQPQTLIINADREAAGLLWERRKEFLN